MSDFTLYINSIAFTSFEIPESIKAGGAQSLFKNKYPGGGRTIDAMGPDDSDISWSGIFLDGTAQDRCRQLDIIRRQGQQVVVIWAGYQYLAVVASFEWDFKRIWHIPYTITLAVVQDLTQPQQDSGSDVDSQITDDTTQASSDVASTAVSVDDLTATNIGMITSSDIDNLSSSCTALSAATDAVNATTGSVTSVSTGTVDFQSGLSTQVNTALTASQGLQSALDPMLSNAGNPAMFASGTSPQNMITAITNLSVLSSATAATVDCSNVLGRTSVNIGALGK
jgi:hypothetical protein